jgi:hypothetical protein
MRPMEQNRTMGFFLMATGLLVLVPVVLQLRARDYALREVWGYFVFVLGLFAVGFGYAFFEGADQRRLSLGGLAAVLIGLFFVQYTDRKSQTGPRQ